MAAQRSGSSEQVCGSGSESANVASMGARLAVTREQVLAYRRRVTALDERLPMGGASLRQVAWAGLADSVPRAALLCLHARVEDARPDTWEHESLVQLWGPRFSVYVVAAVDRAVFTLGRTSDLAERRALGQDLADRLEKFLQGRRLPVAEAARGIGVGHPSALRYAAPTGRLVVRWDGARQPLLWMVSQPEMGVTEARLELARRYLHAMGPGTVEGFGAWAGVKSRTAAATLEAFRPELTPVDTPVGEAWVLAADEATLRQPAGEPAPVRLLPSGDTFFLLQGADRELLVPEPDRRKQLWPSRVWPGAILIDGDVVGVWRRAQHVLNAHPWTRLSARQRQAVEAEATALPLPGVDRDIVIHWANA